MRPVGGPTNSRELCAPSHLKQGVDGDISVAESIQLAHYLLVNDLVDEIHLMSFPALLGHSRRLWTETPDRSAWTLADVRTYGEGVLVTILERAR